MRHDNVNEAFLRHEGYARDDDRGLVYWLSWTAYPGLLLRLALHLVVLLVAYAVALRILRIHHPHVLANTGVIVAFGLALAWTAYDVQYLRTMKLYVDRRGVWLYQGVLPWRAGLIGARWDQIGEATCTPSFLSWACKSYRVCVTQRYTGTTEIFLTHVHDGHLAVQSINRLLAARARGS